MRQKQATIIFDVRVLGARPWGTAIARHPQSSTIVWFFRG